MIERAAAARQSGLPIPLCRRPSRDAGALLPERADPRRLLAGVRTAPADPVSPAAVEIRYWSRSRSEPLRRSRAARSPSGLGYDEAQFAAMGARLDAPRRSSAVAVNRSPAPAPRRNHQARRATSSSGTLGGAACRTLSTCVVRQRRAGYRSRRALPRAGLSSPSAHARRKRGARRRSISSDARPTVAYRPRWPTAATSTWASRRRTPRTSSSGPRRQVPRHAAIGLRSRGPSPDGRRAVRCAGGARVHRRDRAASRNDQPRGAPLAGAHDCARPARPAREKICPATSRAVRNLSELDHDLPSELIAPGRCRALMPRLSSLAARDRPLSARPSEDHVFPPGFRISWVSGDCTSSSTTRASSGARPGAYRDCPAGARSSSCFVRRLLEGGRWLRARAAWPPVAAPASRSSSATLSGVAPAHRGASRRDRSASSRRRAARRRRSRACVRPRRDQTPTARLRASARSRCADCGDTRAPPDRLRASAGIDRRRRRRREACTSRRASLDAPSAPRRGGSGPRAHVGPGPVPWLAEAGEIRGATWCRRSAPWSRRASPTAP